MFNFIQKLIYSFLSLQEKTLNKQSNVSSIYANSTTKRAYNGAASLELTSKTQTTKIKVENNVKNILKKYENNPQKLLQFIEKNGTKVYKLPCATKILKIIGYEEGFIGATKGLKALFLNLATSIIAGKKVNTSFSTEPMIVLNNISADNFSVIQIFYKWYGMKSKLPGFDCNSQDNLQKYLAPTNKTNIKDLTIEEILGLKEAIARDMESLNFVIDLAKNTAGSKNALKKITAGGASV